MEQPSQKPPSPLTVVSWIAGLLLVMAIVHSVQIYQQQEASMEALTEMRAADTSAQTAINNTHDQIRDLRSRVEELESWNARHKENNSVIQDRLQQQDTALHSLQGKVDKQESATADLKQKFELGQQASAPPPPEATVPRPFSYYEGVEWRGLVSQYMSEARDANARQGLIDGGGGRDTLLGKEGSLDLDGVSTISMEIILYANGKANNINIEAPGLARLEGNAMQIDADKELDKVEVDGCLTWKKGEGTDPAYDEWGATDSEGAVRTVKISRGVSVEQRKTCDNRYLLQKKWRWTSRMPRTASGTKDNISRRWTPDELTAGLPPHMRKLDMTGAIHFDPDLESDIALYEKWAAGLPTPAARASIGILIGQMKKRKVSTMIAVAEWYGTGMIRVLKRPPFDPSKQEGEDQAYFKDDNTDKVIDLTGNEIYATRGGSDDINAGTGTDIFIIEKNWGKMKISKSCADAELPSDKTLYIERGEAKQGPPAYGGVGLSFLKKGGELIVQEAFEGKPAARAGIRKGDRIITVNGQDVTGLSFKEAVAAIRGAPGNELSLSVKKERSETAEIIKMQRETIILGVDNVSSPAKQLTDYIWKHGYANWIVFGPGINKKDMAWQDENVLVNVATGDTLTIPKNCFTLVYKDE